MNRAQIRPEIGDVLYGRTSLGREKYLIRGIHGEHLDAVPLGWRKTERDVISLRWTDFALAGFRLQRYHDVQNMRAVTLVGASAIAFLAVGGCFGDGAIVAALEVLCLAVAAAAAYGLYWHWQLRRVASQAASAGRRHR